jgi:hypothetical protein
MCRPRQILSMLFTRKQNEMDEGPGRSSGLAFLHLPVLPGAEQWLLRSCLVCLRKEEVGRGLTATGIAPDFNGIPF